MKLTPAKKQRGAVLLLSLVMVLTATILALSGLSSSIMQSKMVAATADSYAALASAEMALKSAELAISRLQASDISDFNTAAPLYAKGEAAVSDQVFDTAYWVGATVVTGNPNNIQDGAYVIELMNDASGYTDKQITQANNIQGAGNHAGGNLYNGSGNPNAAGKYTFHTFRIVAQGRGQSSHSLRVIEAYYRRGF